MFGKFKAVILMVVGVGLTATVSGLDYPMYVQTIVLGGDGQYKYDVIKNSGFPGVLWELNPGGLPGFVDAALTGGEVELYGTYAHLNDDWDATLEVIGETESNLVVTTGGYTDDQTVANELIALAEKVSPQGRTVMIYPHTGQYVETSRDAVSILELVDRPDVGMVFTMPHMMMVHNSRSLEWDVATEIEHALPYIMSFSMCGADSESSDWGTLIQPLGEGDYDNLTLVKILLEMGYQGTFSLQAYGVPGDPNIHFSNSNAEWVSIMDSLSTFAGCKDQEYEEYNESATISDPKLCQTPVVNTLAPKVSHFKIETHPHTKQIRVNSPIAFTMELHDLKGNLIFMSNGEGPKTFDLNGYLESGLYLAHISSGRTRQVHKITFP